MATESLESVLQTTELSHENIKTNVGDVVLGLYQKHFQPFNKTEYAFDLLCAIWTKAEGLMLLQTNETSITEITDYGLIGRGLYLAQFLSESYFSKGRTRDEVLTLAVDVLRKVKGHVDGCGGNTDVLWLESDGDWRQVSTSEIADTEKFSKGFDAISQELSRVVSDLSLDETEIDDFLEIVRDLAHGARAAQRERIARLAKIREIAEKQRKEKLQR